MLPPFIATHQSVAAPAPATALFWQAIQPDACICSLSRASNPKTAPSETPIHPALQSSFLRKLPALCSRKVTTTKLIPTNAESLALMNHDRAKPGLAPRFRTSTATPTIIRSRRKRGACPSVLHRPKSPNPRPRPPFRPSQPVFIPPCGKPAVGHSQL